MSCCVPRIRGSAVTLAVADRTRHAARASCGTVVTDRAPAGSEAASPAERAVGSGGLRDDGIGAVARTAAVVIGSRAGVSDGTGTAPRLADGVELVGG
jgi:hypothetical protein